MPVRGSAPSSSPYLPPTAGVLPIKQWISRIPDMPQVMLLYKTNKQTQNRYNDDITCPLASRWLPETAHNTCIKTVIYMMYAV